MTEVRVGRRSVDEVSPAFSIRTEMNLAVHWTLTGVSLLQELQDKAWQASGITNKDSYYISSHMNHQGWTFDTKICKWIWEEVEDEPLKRRVGKIVRVTEGLLKGKYAMVVKDFKGGVGVITEPSDWPACIPSKYNALFVLNGAVVEILEEEATTIGVKFPRPSQFK